MYLCERERLGECMCGTEGGPETYVVCSCWCIRVRLLGSDGKPKKPLLRTSCWRTHSIMVSLEIYHLDGSPVFLPLLNILIYNRALLPGSRSVGVT